MKAEELSFKEEGVYGVRKDILLPWYNAYKFLIQNIQRYENLTNKDFVYDESITNDLKTLENSTDKWIIVTKYNFY